MTTEFLISFSRISIRILVANLTFSNISHLTACIENTYGCGNDMEAAAPISQKVLREGGSILVISQPPGSLWKLKVLV